MPPNALEKKSNFEILEYDFLYLKIVLCRQKIANP